MNNLGDYPGSLKSCENLTIIPQLQRYSWWYWQGNKLAARRYQASDTFLPFVGLSQTLVSSFSCNFNLLILVQEHASGKLCLTSTTSGLLWKAKAQIAQNSSRGKQPFHQTSWGTKVCGKLFIDMARVQNYAQNKYSYHHYCSVLTAVLRRPQQPNCD